MNFPKDLRTVDGREVIHPQYVPFNSAGRPVTFPIKGTIILQRNPIKKRYAIWQKDGRISIWGKRKLDLVLDTPTSNRLD